MDAELVGHVSLSKNPLCCRSDNRLTFRPLWEV